MQHIFLILLFSLFAVTSSFYFGKTLACRDMEKYPVRSARYCIISCRARGRISGECLWLEKEGVNKTMQKIASCNCTEEKITTTPRTKATKFATTIKSEETTPAAGSEGTATTMPNTAETSPQPNGTSSVKQKPTEQTTTEKVDLTITSTADSLDTSKPEPALKSIPNPSLVHFEEFYNTYQ